MKTLLILLLLNTLSYSNEPNVVATVNSNNIVIGEELIMSFEINSNGEYDIIFPNYSDTLSSFEIINISKIDTIKQENILKYKQNLSLIQFDSGHFEIPSIKFVYKDKNDSNKLADFRTISTNSIPVYVNSVQIDTTQTFKDIKPLMDVPFSIWEIINYIYFTLGFLILALILWYLYKKYYKNRVKEEDNVPYDPKIPADILALEALKKLSEEKLWQNNEFKLYYTKLTDILRIYIFRVYDINALDMTSSEILEELKSKNIDEILFSNLKYIFTNSDLVKFAKEKPIQEINESAINYAFDFVEKTKSLIVKNEEEED